MFNIPINHKTIFVFDHSKYFSNECGQTYEYDVSNKAKPNTSQQSNLQKLNPLSKTLWTVNIESALEFCRIIYDLFPEDKLIRMISSKSETTLNSWSEQEQGLDHLMNVMGTVMPPSPQAKQLFEGEEFINLCKALHISVNSIAQISRLQQNLCTDTNHNDRVPNSGRIILFTSAKCVNLDQIQDFLHKSIEECNRNIEVSSKNEKNPPEFLPIKMVEFVVIDVVPCFQDLTFENEILNNNSSFMRTRIISSKSGQHLPTKLINLAQRFYELSITSVTNIPMKEELNANSSANYDVDILHVKSLHDQIKICGLLKSCQKDANSPICLKWSNPKTTITEFNFSSFAYRITPIDVNSRPASCLTSFLLSGRCVVLEVPRTNSSANTRISSHVLCNHGNEIFMHCLNITGKSNLEDRPSIEDLDENINNYRRMEFIDLIKENMLVNSAELLEKKNKFSIKSILTKLEKSTKKWPITYSELNASNLMECENSKSNQTIGSIEIKDFKIENRASANDFQKENEKLSKRKVFIRNINIGDNSNLLDVWSNSLTSLAKIKPDFYGRKSNPNSLVAPLYPNLKIDETYNKNMSAKMEIS